MKKTLMRFLLLLIFFLAFFFPDYDLIIDVPTILTAVSLLFTILVGFFIAAATSNYLNLQSNISKEDSCLIYVFGLVKIIQPDAEPRIAKAIDDYMISSLDFEYLEYVNHTGPEFDALAKVIDSVCVEAGQENPLVQNLQNAKETLLTCRMEGLMAAQKVVTKKHWFILIALSSVISILLLSLRMDSLLSSLLVGITILAIYQALSLLRDIDANVFLADKIGYGAEPQSVFRAIGAAEYYPENALKGIDKRKLGQRYRVGVYTDYPKSYKKEIKLVNN